MAKDDSAGASSGERSGTVKAERLTPTVGAETLFRT